MRRSSVYRLLPMLVVASALSGMVPAETVSPIAIREGAVSRAIGVSVLRTGQGVRILVDGLSFKDVTAWLWQGRDIGGLLQGALAKGSAVKRETALGFELEWNHLPKHLNGLDRSLKVDAASKGVSAAAEPLICPIPTVFGLATRPARPADPRCSYGSTVCLQPGLRHTGMDYSGSGDTIAIADGKVVRVEALNANDHGMGNNVLVRHVLPGPTCNIVYSGYAHLASIDPAVTAGQTVRNGQTLGPIGGSGNGDPNAFPPHLHLEMKSRPVSGNPFGVGDQTQTCATDPADAAGDSCWRYVAGGISPDEYGYLNPADYLNRLLVVPVYREVGVGDQHVCGLGADNTLTCWGSNYYGQATPPAGQFKQASAGHRHSCALREDNTVACWGDNEFWQVKPPVGQFKEVSAGGLHTCAVKTDDTLACWGSNSDGQTDPPDGTFSQLSAGGWHSCAFSSDNTLVCWGRNEEGQATPPAVAFTQVSAGLSHTCGVKADSTVACWGANWNDQARPYPAYYKQVSAGSDHSCGVKTDDSVVCWGMFPAWTSSPAGAFKQVSAGGSPCAIRADNTVVCWDARGDPTTWPIGIRQVAVGGAWYPHACVLRADGTLACSGNNDKGQATPPSGTFTQVVAGVKHNCALKADATIACWGYTGTPPTGRFKQLSAGGTSNLGLREDGTLVGWGLQAIQPVPGRFKQVSRGGAHNCAIRLDDTLVCWGSNNSYGQLTPPRGKFKQISAGAAHNCAVRSDGRLACWGWNADGQATPGKGTFRQVSAGERFTCGIRSDYTLACWGWNEFGQATPPSGTFLQVSTGTTAACAVRTEGSRVCWGVAIP